MRAVAKYERKIDNKIDIEGYYNLLKGGDDASMFNVDHGDMGGGMSGQSRNTKRRW
jgi:hypothetical protein